MAAVARGQYDADDAGRCKANFSITIHLCAQAWGIFGKEQNIASDEKGDLDGFLLACAKRPSNQSQVFFPILRLKTRPFRGWVGHGER